MALSRYNSKRDFTKTGEPTGEEPSIASRRPVFVIQKHQASRLHFDLRLEFAGVLKSWAVPKGLSADPSVKRLAVEVEDHPLSYANFEGVIPPGQYGAGSVIVWDTGWWEPDAGAETGLTEGKLYFTLHGQRVCGRWRLVRTKSSGKQPQWLLSKVDDDQADRQVDLVKQHTTSVVSGLTLQQVAQTLPKFIDPKLPSIVSTPPDGAQWIHELKLDGYRMQARWSPTGFSLRTRTGVDWTSRYPSLASELAKLELTGTIMDGELTAVDELGRSNFSALQSPSGAQATTLAYFAFDLLYLRGCDIRQQPLLERKAQLRQLLKHSNAVMNTQLQFLDHIHSDPGPLLAECRRLGLEGIVSKRVERPYGSGRARDWLKYKERQREMFVIGGFETNADNGLSSLLLGYFADDGKQDGHKERELTFAGRVGTGWSVTQAKALMASLSPHTTRSRPFSKAVPVARSKSSQLRVHWVKPELAAEVAFAGWTDTSVLRQASFIAVSDLHDASHITRESVFEDSQPDVEETAPLPSQPSAIMQARIARPQTIDLPLATGLTNPNRLLFAADEITKSDVAAYLYQVGQWLLPHVSNRPVSLLRCPSGIEGQQYFQRHPQQGFPDEIESLSASGQSQPLLVLKNMPGVLATAQISAIELHPWGCRADRLDRPDRMTVDLDPDEAVSWHRVVEAALLVKDLLADRGLVSFVKTTGGKGLHVVVPLVRRTSWEKLFEYSKTLANQLAKNHRQIFVDNMSKAKRRDRIYVDYHRNRRGSTAIAAYSLRARPGATVSTPLAWEELPHVMPGQFTIRTLPTRLAKLERDPWAELASLKQYLPPQSSF